MHIIIQKRILTFNNYKVKCAVGKRGIGNKKKEGDKITPKGKFKIKSILFRKDRVPIIKTKINKICIKKNMGWCDDPRSKNYNKLVKLPSNYKSEKLFKKDNTYDIILVLNYNFNPIVKGKGSAIFIHVARKGYKNTMGCIAISKRDLKNLIKKISNRTTVNIS